MLKTPGQQMIFISLSTLLAAFSLGSIVSFTDPFTASKITFGLFYASLYLLSLGVFTLLGLFIRQWLGHKIYVVDLSNSFRQALLISALVVISFILLAQRLMFWWVEGSVILFLIFLEVFLNLKI